jgi:hypothetical protein
MAKKIKKDTLRYKISQIHTLKFSFKDIELDRLNQLFEQQNRLGLNTKTSINIDKDKSIITIDINTNLFDKGNNEDLVEHSGRTVYQVQGLENVYNPYDKNYDIPDGFIAQLFGIAYSHARALLATEISPTIYKDKYILPVIDPSKLLKQQGTGNKK